MNSALLSEYLTSLDLPAYRLRQIEKNYYSGRYDSFDQMTDLPQHLRDDLESKFKLLSVSQDKIIVGQDTTKVSLSLPDNQKIESVLMNYDSWVTACVSSQVGCPLACSFCATGKMGLKRNLTAEEIIDQVIFWNHYLSPKYVGRVVFMGMGEPFLNWANLLKAIAILNSKSAINLGQRKISISTAGIVPRIYDFADLNTEINLAISLHSLNQDYRQKIMPVARQYSLIDLIKSVEYYCQKTKRQVFFEYALMDNINDHKSDLIELISLLKSNPLYYLNVIPLNHVSGGMMPSTSNNLNQFVEGLTKARVNFSVRHSFGQSIQSACGQLITE